MKASMRKLFLEEIRRRILLADGAMGTMLYSKGIFINTCFDDLNITRPQLVEEIHTEYLHAGADILETNTFGANRYKLAAFGIEDRVRDINEAGGRIARAVAGGGAYVAGSIGPLGKPLKPLGNVSTPEALRAFEEQAGALAPFIDLFCIETIHGLEEVKIAIEAVRACSDLPIIAQLTFTEEGETIMGESPEQVAAALSELDVAAIGCNCSIGPQPMLEIIEKMRPLTDKPMSAQPNAGAPRIVEGRFLYLTSPEYMAEYAKRFIQSGVSIVGGCCGTTPDHIRAMRNAIRALQPVHIESAERMMPPTSVRAIPEVPFKERSRFAGLMGRKFLISVEIDPPRGLDSSVPLEGARLMKIGGADAINIADGPRASARMSPMALATLIEQRVGIETILHYCCRDRNLLGMQSDLIGAHAMGLKNILVITGDPPKLGDYPDATAVYDVDSIGLVRIIKAMNNGLDPSGKSLEGVTGFAIGVGANPAAIDMETEVRRFHEKVKAGAEFALTQPVYDPSLLERFLELTAGSPIPVLVGILPLTSHKNAEFLHNEVPGMHIPQRVRDAMAKAPTGDKARELGIKISQEALAGCRSLPRIAGAYIMPPFGKYDSVLRIMDAL
ncbi:MAG: bifunctional homocysteine S-methyltransferase/methylenetetrahydrofolate reductase [Chitinivibrionia bacterium]|nr:bifunctional homocysteine S-methyltransferase/methylenetetrahydrofolate reductase [Chitinivibrionia bacterium]